METFIGRPLPRLEDQRFLTGAGRYTADLDLPNQAHAMVVRSPHAHAQIAGIDAEAARHALASWRFTPAKIFVPPASVRFLLGPELRPSKC